jgi:hypothetical protein
LNDGERIPRLKGCEFLLQVLELSEDNAIDASDLLWLKEWKTELQNLDLQRLIRECSPQVLYGDEVQPFIDETTNQNEMDCY